MKNPNYYDISKHDNVLSLSKRLIEEFKDLDKYQSVCYFNVLKYVLRAPNKNGIEDLEKARDYLNELLTKKKQNEPINYEWCDSGLDIPNKI